MSGGDSKFVHKRELQCMGAGLAQRDQVIGELTVGIKAKEESGAQDERPRI